MKEHEKLSEMRRLNFILLSLAVLTIVNLLLTASLSGLLGSILILVMVWGIHRGDYPLTKGLSIFLFIYATLNLLILGILLIFRAEIRASSGVWLAVYSLALLLLGVLLRGRQLQGYLKTAPQPKEKKKKITFFRGGWRDL